MPEEKKVRDPIEFFTDQELIDEILSRYDHGVIAVLKEEAPGNAEVEMRRFYFTGGPTFVLGIMEIMRAQILDGGTKKHTPKKSPYADNGPDGFGEEEEDDC